MSHTELPDFSCFTKTVLKRCGELTLQKKKIHIAQSEILGQNFVGIFEQVECAHICTTQYDTVCMYGCIH